MRSREQATRLAGRPAPSPQPRVALEFSCTVGTEKPAVNGHGGGAERSEIADQLPVARHPAVSDLRPAANQPDLAVHGVIREHAPIARLNLDGGKNRMPSAVVSPGGTRLRC